MSVHVEGTIVQSTVVESVKYQYAPRDAQDDRPWLAIYVPAILTMLMGDENNEIRFNGDDIQENIDTGKLEVIYTP